ncbi:MAG: AAA family ATPase [Desulfovibrio sp.]|jgi:hypothetical protein|nr:AAA family ATPase [Desulfovibrio sp.]
MQPQGQLRRSLSDFQELRTGNVLYVDKTEHLVKLFHADRQVFIARPRRFGKSLMVSLLKNLYKGNHELFSGLAIEDHLDEPIFRPHPVIHLDMSSFTTPLHKDNLENRDVFTIVHTIEAEMTYELSKIAKEYGVQIAKDTPYIAFDSLIYTLAKNVDKSVILIDEYDNLLTATHDKPHIYKHVRGILQNFYKKIKINEEHIHAAYLTGISKLAVEGIFSFLNNVTDVSMDPEYYDMFGFTHTELSRCYGPYLAVVAKERRTTEKNLLDQIKSHYNGYSFSGEETVYNPVSIHSFLLNKALGDYWIETGDQNFIKRYLTQKNVTAEELEYVDISLDQITWPGEISEALKPEIYLYQAGYLTYRKISSGRDKYYLTYPNDEVRLAMIGLVQRSAFSSADEEIEITIDLNNYLINEDYSGVLGVFNKVFPKITYDEYAKLEDLNSEVPLEYFYRNVVFSLMLCAKLNVYFKEYTSVGRSHLILSHGDRKFIFVFKISQLGTRAEIAQKLKTGITQVDKCISPSDGMTTICMAINGKNCQISLAAINNDIYSRNPDERPLLEYAFVEICDRKSFYADPEEYVDMIVEVSGEGLSASDKQGVLQKMLEFLR